MFGLKRNHRDSEYLPSLPEKDEVVIREHPSKSIISALEDINDKTFMSMEAIVRQLITMQSTIDALVEGLPEGKKAQFSKREDGSYYYRQSSNP